jgi:predicted nucleic acid-binding Zn ribbon protein
MPSYQYKCSNKNCNEEKIVICKMSEYSPTIKCECGDIMTRKPDDLICGISIDKTNSFYRSIN